LASKKYVFENVVGEFLMIGDFSSDLASSEAQTIAAVRASVVTDPLMTLGDNFTISRVAATSLGSDQTAATDDLEDVFVASGQGESAVVGGTAISTSGQTQTTIFSGTQFLTNLAASTALNLIDNRFGGSDSSGILGAFGGAIGDGVPSNAIVVTSLLSNSFVSVGDKTAQNGAIAEVTVANKNPVLDRFPKLALGEQGEIWLRDQLVSATPALRVYRTEGGKGMGDFVVVVGGKAVVFEVKRPTGGKQVAVAEFNDSPAQVKVKEYPNVVSKTVATSVAGRFEVSVPLNPTAADFALILAKINQIAGN
jgi:hypothetical protein